jgi:preprotein translocase subunit SecG
VGKVIMLLILILLAVVSLTGFVFLSEQIAAGENEITRGQKQLEIGQAKLEAGKAELEAGKQMLSEGKQEYAEAKDNVALVFLDNLQGGKGFREGKAQIDDGEQQVATGESQINVGAKRINAGELELSRGVELLSFAKGVRVVSALAAIIFTVLSVIIAIRWRRTPVQFILNKPTK